MISIVVATTKEDILRKNILASPMVKNCELILQYGFTNIGKAYNKARPAGEVVLYAHQDVFMPAGFERDLKKAINNLKNVNWGVLGVAGAKITKEGKKKVGCILYHGREWGQKEGLPEECDTLDELLLITKGDMKFDEKIPTCHFYGADLCLEAKKQGRKVMAIDAFCHHNSTNSSVDAAFWRAADYMRKKWKKSLPFATTCALIE